MPSMSDQDQNDRRPLPNPTFSLGAWYPTLLVTNPETFCKSRSKHNRGLPFSPLFCSGCPVYGCPVRKYPAKLSCFSLTDWLFISARHQCLSRISCHCCHGCPALSRLSCYGCPALAVLFFLSPPGCPGLAGLAWPGCPARQSCPGWPVFVVLS
jgi:hypothetical protein